MNPDAFKSVHRYLLIAKSVNFTHGSVGNTSAASLRKIVEFSKQL